MTVSIDGLRRNLLSAYKRACAGYREAIEENGYNESFKNLKTGLDDLRQMIGALMCCYSDDPEDLFSDMSYETDQLPFAHPEEEA